MFGLFAPALVGMVNIGYLISTVPTNLSILYISLVTALNFYSYILDKMCCYCSPSGELPSWYNYTFGYAVRSGLIVNIGSIRALCNAGYLYATWLSKKET